jgi:hypothetical protein
MFTGYSEKEIVRICYPNKTTKLDDCPWIWKRFDKANYLTALVEDAPKVSAFNYKKTGFVQQPVDFYSRPLWIAASELGGASEGKIKTN